MKSSSSKGGKASPTSSSSSSTKSWNLFLFSALIVGRICEFFMFIYYPSNHCNDKFNHFKIIYKISFQILFKFCFEMIFKASIYYTTYLFIQNRAAYSYPKLGQDMISFIKLWSNNIFASVPSKLFRPYFLSLDHACVTLVSVTLLIRTKLSS